MRKLYLAASASIALSIVVAVAYVFVSRQAPVEHPLPLAVVLLEAFKILLSFSLITTGGVVAKGLVDQLLSNERDRRTEADRHEETRLAILKEFAGVFSDFYSIRKLYHSARSTHNTIYDLSSAEYKSLIMELLKRSVDLEGRYGALKVLAITHFNLPRGEFGAKDIAELSQKIRDTSDEAKQVRLRLDLLGEHYDDWRHALEGKRKIRSSDEFFADYEKLLAFLERAK
jgi:hypothetical protein